MTDSEISEAYTTNLHNNTDIKEATITFDDGGLVIIKTGDHE